MFVFVCALGDFLVLFAPVLRQIARYLPHHRSENASKTHPKSSHDKFKTASNIYFIKRTKEIKELFDNLFAWNINDYFISSITMKITLPANGNDFNYQFIAPMYLTPNYPCGNTVKDFIELFIDKLGDNIIHL